MGLLDAFRRPSESKFAQSSLNNLKRVLCAHGVLYENFYIQNYTQNHTKKYTQKYTPN